MRIRLYAGQACWVCVPEFLLPPASSDIYRPLVFEGICDTEDLPAEQASYLEQGIDRHLFAVLPLGELTNWPLLDRSGAGALE